MAVNIYMRTLNVNRLNTQLQDIGWLNGLKTQTHLYASFKRYTSDLKTHRDWKWKDRGIVLLNGKWKKARIPIFTSEMIDFKTKTKTKDKDYKMIKGSVQEEYNIWEYLCT